ncbi:hypothetical protein [Legionella shakespearei]|uniref:Sialidase domain-containing protein n=1 Tax=Legionella shakespearei DSM 23087 TaxID=1122169 RepID=A0A0W0YZK0_9GAMM|nr:hypothetical protein [Legionella shakespearei]KTD62300.1 hypothetical protein Lsha_1000 [Legionella shakespearei DSM 23087]
MSVIVLHSTDGLTWSDPVRLTEKFHSMPAVVIHQHKLCFAWQDSDNQLNTLILQFDQGKCKITNREKPADGLTGSPQFYSYLHHLWVAYPTKNVLNTLLVSLNPQCDNKYTSQYEVLDALMTDSEKSSVNYKP